MQPPLVLPKPSKAALRKAAKKAKAEADKPQPEPEPIAEQLAVEIFAGALLRWPHMKWNVPNVPEGIDHRVLDRLMIRLGKPTDPLAHTYSAVGWDVAVDQLICLHCYTITTLTRKTFHQQGGYEACCPNCSVSVKDFTLRYAVTSVWLPSQLSHFPTKFQYAVRQRVLDRISAS